MKKSLIALLVAGIPAAAFADVTIYGAIKGGVETVDNGAQTQTNIDDLGSRIGFKGNEDLGNGLKAIWQVETGFKADGSKGTGSASGTFANRESFIGLASDFGTVRLGNINNYANDMSQIDPWEYNNEALGLGTFTRDHGRVKNSIRIDTPTWNGFQAAFLYGTKEDRNNDVSNVHQFGVIDTNGNQHTVTGGVTNDDRDVYNLGLSYENSGFFGMYSFTREGAFGYKATITSGSTAITGSGKLPENNKHQLEVGYNANNLFVGFGYKFSKGDASVLPISTAFDSSADAALAGAVLGGDKKFESSEYALTGAYTMGRFTPKASFAMAQDFKYDGNKVANSGYKQIVVGVDYALSKRTTLGAQYGHLKMDNVNARLAEMPKGEDTLNAYGVSLVHKF